MTSIEVVTPRSLNTSFTVFVGVTTKSQLLEKSTLNLIATFLINF